MSGTNRHKQLIAEGPAIVLVEPQLGENIGMVARAMANFGLAELRIVNPRDGWPSERARAAASRADHVIDGTRVFSTLPEAIADLRYVYATTARPRDMIKQVDGPGEAAGRLRELFLQDLPTGILFGRERWGLENEEIALANAIVTFPVNPAFASLNIAQAVLLMAYEWMKSGDAAQRERNEQEMPVPARREDIAGLCDHLERALDENGYFHPAEKRERMALNLRNLLSRQNFTDPEVRSLRGAISALERRWQRGRQD